MEGGVVLVARRPMDRVDLKRPRETARATEEFLVEVVADPADRLGDQQRRRRCIEESRDVGAAAAKHPEASEGPGGDAAPDAEPPVPDRNRSPPMRRHFVPARREEVKAPADQPGGKGPDRDVLNKATVAPGTFPAAACDRHRREHCGDVGEAVRVDDEWSDIEAARWWAGDRGLYHRLRAEDRGYDIAGLRATTRSTMPHFERSSSSI